MKKLFIFMMVIFTTTIFAQNFEGFENENFDSFNWEFDGDQDWFITDTQSSQGNYSARSGAIGNNQTSELSIELSVTSSGEISFDWAVSSQQFYDILNFYIDENLIAYISGEQEWANISRTINPGLHTFTWEYSKNLSYNENSDCGFIDNITFPSTATHDNDLAAVSISNPYQVYAGDAAVFAVTIRNVGHLNQSAYTMNLYYGDGTLLESLNIDTPLYVNHERTHHLAWIIDANTEAEYGYAYAEVYMDGDENEPNNITSTVGFQILPAGLHSIEVGHGIENTNWYPMNFEKQNNIAETIYYGNEIGYTGEIIAIGYKNAFTETLYNKAMKVWFGEGTNSTLANGWIAANQLESVFDGTLNFPAGNNIIYVPLDEPFPYNGNNLIVMVNRPLDTETYGIGDNLWFETYDDNHPARTRAANSNSQLNPNNPPNTSFVFSRFPNAIFYMNIDGLGILEGYVYDENNNPLPETNVTIDATDLSTYTNSDGFFRFGNVFAGNISVTASCVGYYDASTSVTIVEDQTATTEISLTQLPLITVSGTIVGSDFPEIGLDGSEIYLTGYSNFDTITDENGDFVINNVFADNQYTFSASCETYETHEIELSLSTNDEDLETIILTEITYQPENVLAEINEENTEVNITWTAPSRDFEFYTVYRFPTTHISYPELWEQIATGFTTTGYTDEDWNNQEVGYYYYGINATYSNGAESETVLTLSLHYDGVSADENLLFEPKIDNFPNPFNPETTINFSLASDSSENTNIIIYNAKGQMVKQLVNDKLEAGNHSIIWNGTDKNGANVSSGIYLLKLSSDNKEIAKKKCILLK